MSREEAKRYTCHIDIMCHIDILVDPAAVASAASHHTSFSDSKHRTAVTSHAHVSALSIMSVTLVTELKCLQPSVLHVQLAERRMDVEEIPARDVTADKFAKVHLIEYHLARPI